MEYFGKGLSVALSGEMKSEGNPGPAYGVLKFRWLNAMVVKPILHLVHRSGEVLSDMTEFYDMKHGLS
jgi:hypothetical protein